MILCGRSDSGAAAMSLAFAVFRREVAPAVRCSSIFRSIEDPREPWRVAHPLPEVLLLVVCGTIADCDDYDGIAAWGEAHLAFLRQYLPYTSWRSGRALADPADEPNQSGPVFGRVHRLGARDLARPARSRRHRRQDLAPQPRSRPGQGAPASCLGLRHHQPLVLGQEAGRRARPTRLTAIPVLLERLGAKAAD